jgi:hypothetical protein
VSLAERIDPQRYPDVALFVQTTQINTVVVDGLRDLIAGCVGATAARFEP